MQPIWPVSQVAEEPFLFQADFGATSLCVSLRYALSKSRMSHSTANMRGESIASYSKQAHRFASTDKVTHERSGPGEDPLLVGADAKSTPVKPGRARTGEGSHNEAAR